MEAGDITVLLTRTRVGDRKAEAQLAALVYDELRRLAGHYMKHERSDHTLQATALVNEAFLRLLGTPDTDWRGRAHFFAVAARVMRQILVDHARAHGAAKRGAGLRADMTEALVFSDVQSDTLVALDDALDRLKEWAPRQVRLVELRFFSGLNYDEAAEVLGISTKTAKRDWAVARSWLRGEIFGGDDTRALGTD
ncbi:MAG: ECF-type sigma factor [Bryobacteraceae bacterium]|jgi:RNA polymerase sigma factor (TIGR02999 family)